MSKIGVHNILGPKTGLGSFMRRIRDAGQTLAVVKCVDDFGPAQEAKQVNPATLTVGRLNVLRDAEGRTFDSQGFVNAWSPLLWFALLFGLSMDYEMFLLSSVKERYEETGDNEASVAWALERTAKPISSAAVAIVAVFGSFALAGTLPPKEMGTGMAIAIAIDATLIRLVLVPAAMRLLGRANWWLPRSLDRVLPRVGFGHSAARD